MNTLNLRATHHPLPDPSSEAIETSQKLCKLIEAEIAKNHGWIGFDRFMEMALYTPGLGYYAGGSYKFGEQGDFVTSPEISALFGQSLARQAAQVMALSEKRIIEVGAGSGKLAVDLLMGLEKLDQLPDSYEILELSGELKARQEDSLRSHVPHLIDRIRWLDRFPNEFSGLVLGNEVLDAMPVHIVCWKDGVITEQGVSFKEGRFLWEDKEASGRLLDYARRLKEEFELDAGYISEVNLLASDWVAEWSRVLEKGALLLIDYGFPRHEFYLPQRYTGTLMCHCRHQAHSDPFYLPGLQDITTHIDFTSVAETAFEAGMDVLGYATQSAFLGNCGIVDLLAQYDFADQVNYQREARAVQKLISPSDMGELFKVIAVGKGIDETLLGFATNDRLAML